MKFVPSVDGLERRDLAAIVTATVTTVEKVPGPTDTVEVDTVGTNPQGKLPPGQQSSETLVLSNREARHL
jgi:hypothetical protein